MGKVTTTAGTRLIRITQARGESQDLRYRLRGSARRDGRLLGPDEVGRMEIIHY